MRRNLGVLDRAALWSFITIVTGSPVDKRKLLARLITAVTVLLLILAGLPLGGTHIAAVSAESNPYIPVGQMILTLIQGY